MGEQDGAPNKELRVARAQGRGGLPPRLGRQGWARKASLTPELHSHVEAKV